MTFQKVIERLNLQPLPDEGGYYRQTWKSDSGTAIYFLLTPEENGFSALHELSVVEIYHFYAGDPVRLVLLPPEGRPQEHILGSRLDREEVPQFTVPAGTIQGSRLISGGKWALLGTTMAPPYSPGAFQLSSRLELLNRYPDYHAQIMMLTRDDI